MGSVIQASVQTGLMTEAVNVPPPTAQETIEDEAQALQRHNQMLIKSG